MKILVFSDSHKQYKLMEEVLARLHKRVAAVLHLGDGAEDARQLEKVYPSLKFHYVCGNCDSVSELEAKKILHIGGKKIFMTHGHIYSVKMGYERISYAAAEQEADICLFGHTHRPVIFYYSKTLFLNPGSITYPQRGAWPSYGMLDISDSEYVRPAVVSIQAGEYRIIDVEQ